MSPNTTAPRSHRPWLLPVYIVLVFLIAGFLTYPLWLTLRLLGADPALHKTTLLSLQLVSLGLLLPLHWLQGLRAQEAWGLGQGRSTGRNKKPSTQSTLMMRLYLSGIGLMWGTLMLGTVALVLLMLEVRVPRVGLGTGALSGVSIAWLAVHTALGVALLEELWYRGGLQGAVAAMLGSRGAVLVVAVLYACAHFIRADVPIPDAQIGFFSGYEVITTLFGRFAPLQIWDSWLALLAAGLVLGYQRMLDGCIWRCVGIHMGWVLVIQALRKSTDANPNASGTWLAAGYDGVIGVLALAVFSLVLILQCWRATICAAKAS